MHRGSRHETVARRTFLSRLSVAAAAIGAVFGGASATEAGTRTSQRSVAAGWQPARHPEDDWFEDTPAKHRFFIDTMTADGLDEALSFASNFLNANASGYKLTDADIAEVICLRHHSTSFAFTDAMWAKYGVVLSERDESADSAAGQVPAANPYESRGRAATGNGGVTLSALAKRGVRYAVCAMATRRLASQIARKTGGKVDDVVAELTQNLVPNAHMVAAGIVAVNRAQERGYTLATIP
jgi:intracellular sulfur oxidation DsrE/DsrF family protein